MLISEKNRIYLKKEIILAHRYVMTASIIKLK